jgi:hypothetical protein
MDSSFQRPYIDTATGTVVMLTDEAFHTAPPGTYRKILPRERAPLIEVPAAGETADTMVGNIYARNPTAEVRERRVP